MKMFPENRLGKWAVLLTLASVLLLLTFFLFMAIGMVNFDAGHWWDLTIGVAVPIELIAFILSIMALRKERSVLTYCALVLGVIAILFLLTHSLFIND